MSMFRQLDALNVELKNARRLERLAWEKDKKRSVQCTKMVRRLSEIEELLESGKDAGRTELAQHISRLKTDLAELTMSDGTRQTLARKEGIALPPERIKELSESPKSLSNAADTPDLASECALSPSYDCDRGSRHFFVSPPPNREQSERSFRDKLVMVDAYTQTDEVESASPKDADSEVPERTTSRKNKPRYDTRQNVETGTVESGDPPAGSELQLKLAELANKKIVNAVKEQDADESVDGTSDDSPEHTGRKPAETPEELLNESCGSIPVENGTGSCSEKRVNRIRHHDVDEGEGRASSKSMSVEDSPLGSSTSPAAFNYDEMKEFSGDGCNDGPLKLDVHPSGKKKPMVPVSHSSGTEEGRARKAKLAGRQGNTSASLAASQSRSSGSHASTSSSAEATGSHVTPAQALPNTAPEEPASAAAQWIGLDSRLWKDLPECEVCFSRFVFARRHHCRKCGRCVCSACSPFRWAAPTELNALYPRENSSISVRRNSANSREATEPTTLMAHRVCIACVC